MKYEEVHNMITEMDISDRICLTFKSAVIILYGLLNNSVGKNKIGKAVGYHTREVDFIFHNLWANKIIDGYRWNLEDLEDEKTNWMELILCAMAAGGEIVRVEQSETVSDIEEKPIKWEDLYNYPPHEDYLFSFIIPKQDELAWVDMEKEPKESKDAYQLLNLPPYEFFVPFDIKNKPHDQPNI